MYKAEFTCKGCEKDFETEWTFGDEVTCPHCQTTWETDYEEDWNMNISGPWLVKEISS